MIDGMIDGGDFFDQQIENDKINMIIFKKLQQVNEMILQLAAFHLYFKEHYNPIEIDLSKKIDADPKATLQISFTGNLERDGDTRFFLIIEEAKETVFDFLNGTVKALQFYFALI